MFAKLNLDAQFKKTRYQTVSRPIEVGGETFRFVYLTRFGHVLPILDCIYEQIPSGHFSLRQIDEDQQKSLIPLINHKFIVPSDLDEFEDLCRSSKEDELYLVVQPSSNCQLGCGYCGQEHSSENLSSAEANRILRFAERALSEIGYSRMKVGFFGGEPLIGRKQLVKLGKSLKRMCAEHDVAFSSKLVTNGVALNQGLIEELRSDAGIESVEITIDGPKALHDAARPHKMGLSSYDLILRSISRVNWRDGELVIRVNVTSESANHVDELIDELTDLGLNRISSLYFAPVHSWGNDAHDLGLAREDFAAREIVWKLNLKEKGWRVGFLPAQKSSTCMATRENSFVFTAGGEVFDCTEKPLVDGYASLSSTDYEEKEFFDFFRQVEHSNLPCYDCFAFPVCRGACPKEWVEGRIPCPSFKLNSTYAVEAFVRTAKVR
ncbi:radical SAM/SPASM domain-containing protein [Ruegeria conchae]|uniref:radical SAM/SPASM domain-containing protein n=1 Tax=Ruegeria conchae TaxID=981384 RepID=UPI0029C7B3AB|nr:radical SAM protein [Ruegeria conchae]